MKDSAQPNPPKHLSAEAKRLWRKLVDEYDIDDAGGLAVLTAGLEAFDRMRSAQRSIDAAGVTFEDRFNQLKPHPLLPIERDSRAQWLAALKQLNLDLEPLQSAPGRPPGEK